MEELTGVIDHFLFKNESNGYGVMELTTEDDDVICVGTMAGIDQGEMVRVTGEYVVHPTYGPQLKISSIEVVQPTGAVAIERYLASGIIKGVGPKIAKRIIRSFGEDTLRIIEEEPERLTEIKGISERIAQSIAEQVISKKDQQDAMMFLTGYGITQVLALKIYEAYGSMVYSVIKDNPYRLVEDIEGVGFKKADEIAYKSGISVDSQFRIRCGIIYVLTQSYTEGHTFLPKEMLLSRAEEMLGVTRDRLEEEIPNLVIDRKIVIKQENDRVDCYSGFLYNQELAVASMLRDLDANMDVKNSETVNKIIAKVEKGLGIILDEMQRNAVSLSLQAGVMIITGGPGTGKTTTINTIIRCLDNEGLDVLLAAPTGRAAKRMTEATGYEAKTIHRMLELNGTVSEEGRKAHFERNEDNPLEADVIIIDEMSMVDIQLFYALLKAIPVGGRLILVGDVNQLPSVGPGQVLKDLIDSDAFATVRLQHIFRQASQSDIVVNAHKINNGEEITLDTNSKDFLFLERSDPNMIYKNMIGLITERLPGYVDSTPAGIQVLTPTHMGALGVEAINKVLQTYINPKSDSKREKEFGEITFREGDKVMQVKNDYSLEWEITGKNGILIDKGAGVFNGDVGTVVEINNVIGYLCVEYDECKKVRYTYENLEELELAYAITIHKSQGSEYPAVIMPLLGGPRPLLNRNLLYTGVTRAKKCVIIIGSSETVNIMINNESENKRFTGLCMRIRELM